MITAAPGRSNCACVNSVFSQFQAYWWPLCANQIAHMRSAQSPLAGLSLNGAERPLEGALLCYSAVLQTAGWRGMRGKYFTTFWT